MAASVIRSLLVIGDNHEEIARKYSLDREVEPYVKCRREDASALQKQHLDFIDTLLTTDKVKLTPAQKESYRDLYLDISEMDDFDYYLYITEGCTYDTETMDALTTVNPLAEYRGERCYQERFAATGVEANLTTPFTLKDGTRAYVARKGDIDWSVMHMREEGVNMYKCAWKLVVDYPFPADDNTEDTEKWIKECADEFGIDVEKATAIWKNMHLRTEYFACFKDVDEYVRHSASFWTYGVATADGYTTVSHKVSDKEWVRDFYKDIIEPLSDDEMLSIYEMRVLD